MHDKIVFLYPIIDFDEFLQCYFVDYVVRNDRRMLEVKEKHFTDVEKARECYKFIEKMVQNA